jgi:hypothetical protein
MKKTNPNAETQQICLPGIDVDTVKKLKLIGIFSNPEKTTAQVAIEILREHVRNVDFSKLI